MALQDFLLGTPARSEQLTRLNPQQQQAFSQLLGRLGSGNFGSQFEPIAQQARSQFHQNTIPTIAERFTSMGGGGLSSPAFGAQLGQAASGLEQGLAGQQAQFGLQQQNQLLSLLGMPTFENLYHQRQPGFLESATGPALQALLAYFSGGTSLIPQALGGLMPASQNSPYRSTSALQFNSPSSLLGGF